MAPSPNALATACLAALFLTATPLSSAFTTRSTISNRNINLARSSSSRTAADVPKMAATERPGGHETPKRENDADSRHTAVAVSRGGFFASIATAALGTSAAALGLVLASPESASANGMLDFPPARLNNRYFLMRSGQGASDKEGVVQSHPIDKLHVDNRLTDQGVEETQRAAGVLRALGVGDAFIWADISSRAQDTARILAQELDIRQERVIPEYAFLEPRGMGIFDGKEVATVLPEVYEKDAISLTWRPPPNTDGTPNESVDDVFVRVRQCQEGGQGG
ncbi:conserved unknown protein [Ectocarpus siliculosus]|uniref:Uncharacterized protein n=1 Tax=Ectocarpus siliculosus TaxID=2880 RepID=D7FMD0_ECTSI|nr:conserved unknown protein [Ectocarpus siliculosus]|eukprot:CBJ29948.1 conserved unknown protein [Ectocarpus siliculosus]